MKDLFLGVAEDRFNGLVNELAEMTREMLHKEDSAEMSNSEFFDAVYQKSSAETIAEYYIVGIHTHRLLQEHISRQALGALSLKHHGMMGAGRKAD